MTDMESHFIDDGIWTPMGEEEDFGYYVMWDAESGFTPTAERTWSALKALYR